MNCRCLNDSHPVILKQFSHFATATTHSPCGRYSHFCKFLVPKMYDIKFNNKSDFEIYFQHQFRISYRIILREKELHLNIGVYNPSKVVSWEKSRSLANVFTLRKLLLTSTSSSTHTSSARTCEDVRWIPGMRSASTISTDISQVTGLNGVNFLDRTRTPLEGPHPGLPPQVCSM